MIVLLLYTKSKCLLLTVVTLYTLCLAATFEPLEYLVTQSIIIVLQCLGCGSPRSKTPPPYALYSPTRRTPTRPSRETTTSLYTPNVTASSSFTVVSKYSWTCSAESCSSPIQLVV